MTQIGIIYNMLQLDISEICGIMVPLSTVSPSLPQLTMDIVMVDCEPLCPKCNKFQWA